MVETKLGWSRAALALAIASLVVPAGVLAATPGCHSSFEAGDPALSAAAFGGLDVQIAGGPPKDVVLTAKPDVGFTGTHSLHYAGTSTGSPLSR